MMDPNIWSQFGLSGLIILSFLAGWAYIGKNFLDKWKKSDDEKQALLLATMSEAKGDRERFTQLIEKINEKTLIALHENTKAIQDLRAEIHQIRQ